MKKYKLILYSYALLNVFIIIALLYYWLVILIKSPGVIVNTLIILLSSNIIISLLSIIGINYGYTKLIVRLWVCLFSIIFFYALLDSIGGRLFIPHNLEHSMPDNYVHHKYDPDKVMRAYVPGDFDHLIMTDSMGFRKQPNIGQKVPDIYIIDMLGDSFVAGMEVDVDQTFSYLLEKKLNDFSEQKYEVVNHGISSWAPILEYLQIKIDLQNLSPDLVIMNFDMSDVVQEYVYRKEAKFDENGDPVSVDGFPDSVSMHETLNSRIIDWIYKNLFITTALIEQINKHLGRQSNIEEIDFESAVKRSNRTLLFHTLKNSNFKEFNYYMSLVEDSILRAKNLCDQHGVKFILTTYPWGHQVNDKEWVPGRYNFLPKKFELSDRTIDELERFSKKNGITFFNSLPWYRSYRGTNLLYNHNDMHWTAAGHEEMAKYLTNELLHNFKLSREPIHP